MDLRSAVCFGVYVGSFGGDIVKQRTESQLDFSKTVSATIDRITDVLVFLCSISLAVLAMSAVLIVAPIVLAISVLAGLVNQKSDRDDWYPANA